MFRRRSICRAILLAAVTTMTTAPGTASSQPAAPGDFTTIASGLRPEVRIRKLHLVRPDLIQYPIAFEIYC